MVGDLPDGDQDTAKGLERVFSWARKRLRDHHIALLLALTLAVGLAFQFLPLSRACGNVHMRMALSGDSDSFGTFVRDACKPIPSIGDLWLELGLDLLFIALYGFAVAVALDRWWPRAWRTKFFRRLAPVRFLPIAAAVADLAENASLAVAFRKGVVTNPSDLWMTIASIAGWWKWALVLAALLALALTLIGWRGYHGMPASPPPDGSMGPPSWAPSSEVGICFSGGGIRSASFALGGLQALDAGGIFRKARWVTAVSGGAYTAGAWFIARGKADEAENIPPEPTEIRDGIFAVGGDPDRAGYIRRFRRYLSTGRGGLPLVSTVALGFLGLNVALLAAMLLLVAYPFGAIASSWAIQPDLSTFSYADVLTQSLSVPTRLWLPGLIPIGLAALPIALSFREWDEKRKDRLKLVLPCLGLGVVLLLLLVGLPWLLGDFPRVVRKAYLDLLGNGSATTKTETGFFPVLAALGITGALIRLALKPLSRWAPRLGGAFLALLALLFMGKVAIDVAYREGFFSWDGRVFGAFVAGFCALYWWANPQRWSPHAFYNARLRTTFATTHMKDRAFASAPSEKNVYPLDPKKAPTWNEYAGRSGPELIICAAVQKRTSRVTGIPASSFTFSPEWIGFYESEWTSEPETPTRSTPFMTPGPTYVSAVGQRLGCVSPAVAMSGAAFSSAMGRHSLGTTNALLAALNARLGVWMPNPRYVNMQSGSFKRPRLSYLVKEILGVYDLEDPYVYVTDGGHWENLGLVELVRRKPKFLFCIDASGDSPGSFQTLREAQTLARLECNAEIEIELQDLVPAIQTGLPSEAVAVGVVRYHTGAGQGPDGCPVGVLYYVKLMITARSPAGPVAMAQRERIFPRYPTYDQFLSEDQFDNVVSLGRWAATRGVGLHKRLVAALESNNADTLGGDRPLLIKAFTALTSQGSQEAARLGKMRARRRSQ